MFEDKRFNNGGNNHNSNNRFFMPEDNSTGLNDGNDNLNFNSQSTYVPEPAPIRKKEKKQKNPKIFVIICLIIIIALFMVGIYFGVMAFFTSPDKIYTKVLNDGYSLLEKELKNINNKKLNYDPNLDTLNNSGEIKFETNLEDLEKYSKYTYGYRLNLDVKNAQIDGNIIIKDDSKSIVDIKAYLREKKIYLGDSKIFDKFLTFDYDMSEMLEGLKNTFDYSDILNIVSVGKNYLIDSLDKDKLTKESTTIKVNNKMMKVNNSVYSLSNKDLQNMFEEIIDAIINDNNALKSLGLILNMPVRDLPNYLKEIKENNELFNDFNDIKFNIYTKGLANTFVGFGITVDSKNVFLYTESGNLTEINLVKEVDVNKKKADLVVNINKSGENTDVKASIKDEDIFTVKINKNDDITDIQFNVYESTFFDESFRGSANIEQKRIGDKRQTLKIVANLEYESGIKINFDIDNMTQVGTKIENINTSNAVSFEDLSESDLNILLNNFGLSLQGTGFNDIYTDIAELFKKEEKDPNCDASYNCLCTYVSCECKYLDDAGIERDVSCPSFVEN